MASCFYNPKSCNYKSHLKAADKIMKNLKRRNLVSDGNSNGNASGNASNDQAYESEFAFMTLNNSEIPKRWFLDSCASRHLTNFRLGLFNYRQLRAVESVNAASEGSAVSVVGIGDLGVPENINGK